MSDHITETEKLQEMLETNKPQQAFYETKTLSVVSKGNLVTRLWGKGRQRIHAVQKLIGIDNDEYDQHWKWMGDLTGKRVLDLGCHSGGRLSLSIAEKSGSYLGIDLSRTAIDALRAKLQEKQIHHAKALAVDFLSPEFPDEQYDVIYAHSVLHHFKYFDIFLRKLASHLTDEGVVITRDPLQTSLSVKVARAIYRPFQSDAAWEWPFTEASFEQIQKYFDIVELQGILGQAKWAIPLAFFSQDYAIKLGQRWHAQDFNSATALNKNLWRCMQVSMCLKKR